jgi:4-aminobutyrate aminotransferase-like enzyme
MTDPPFGPLPQMITAVPGPASRALAERLRRVECRNTTYLSDDWPVFWQAAAGACVRDADGNVYLDFTGAFAVAAVGHTDPAVVSAARDQAGRLLHGMGDVHPTELKVRLAETLAEVTPGRLTKSLFSSGGAEAVETALKTAVMRTGRSGVIAFHGAYHGLGPGSLDATARKAFRAPFRSGLGRNTVHLPFPTADRGPAAPVLEQLERLLAHPDTAAEDIGAVLLEPIQGRGGVRIPPADFLPGLRGLCDRHGLVLILDEIYTGFGRTGRWFACEHDGVVPDLMCVGKAMGGGFPISACIGTPEVMDAWPQSTGEALHTSTFLGNPLGCAMALAAIGQMRRLDLPARSADTGAAMLADLRRRLSRHAVVGDIRGRGMMIGVELRGPGRDGERTGGRVAFAAAKAALRRGLLILPGGSFGNVIGLAPPLILTREQADAGIAILDEALAEAAR